jgi:hypothetical protein
MKIRRLSTAFAAAAAGAAIALSVARAEEPAHMQPQKPIAHPLLDALVGTWSTKMSGSATGTGTATFAKGVADTCLLHDETGEHRMGGSGPSMKTGGHGVYRVSDDGRTLTAWWIDNHTAEMVKATGPVSAEGYELSFDTPKGAMRIVMRKTAAGFEFRMHTAGAKDPIYTQVYERGGATR